MTKSEGKHITTGDWFLFVLSTGLIFLSSLLLALSGLIFLIIRLIKAKPILVLVSILILISAYVFLQWMVIPVSWPEAGDTVDVIIRDGDSMHQVVERLKKANLVKHETGFLILSKIAQKDKHIHAGKYSFKKGMTLYSLWEDLFKGNVVLKNVTIPEGLTTAEIAGIFKREIQMDSIEFIQATEDPQIIRSLNLSVQNLEGYLFPETYKLTWGISPRKAVQIMVEQFQRTFNDSLRERAQEINLSVPQVITLASLIEAEAKEQKERAIISAVYHNRLKKGMLLQACPTVTYGLPELDRPLVLKDLERDTPYNTYLYGGLPPGPICNPGRASIIAALYPAEVDYLYFVSKGDGTHVFSKTLVEHDKAKNEIKYRQRKSM
jgi:UPF0755 protein